MISSLTNYTGNSVTTDRILQSLLSPTIGTLSHNMLRPVAACASTLDAGQIATREDLAVFLAEKSFSLVLGVHAFRAGRLLVDCGVPFILVLGGTDMNIDLHRPEKRMQIVQAVGQARVVVAFDNELKTALLGAVPVAAKKTFVIPQAVMLPPGTPRFDRADPTVTGAVALLRQKLGLAVGDRLVLLPAGLRPVKDVLFAVGVFARWATACSPELRLRLRIVGPELDPEYASSVRSALASLEKESLGCEYSQCRELRGSSDETARAADDAHSAAVLYCGPLDRADLVEAMAMSSAVVNTSVSEGQCNSLLEAMAVGTPVVARANTGNRALVSDEVNGLLFDSPDGMIAHIQRLLGDPHLVQHLVTNAKAKVRRLLGVNGLNAVRVPTFPHP